MPLDPWKRAHILSRRADLRAAQVRPAHRRPSWRVVLAVVLCVAATAVLACGLALWQNRALWLGVVREELPAPVKHALPVPRTSVDIEALESGLGIELRQFGNYLDLVKATRDWNPGWEISASGSGHLRMVAPGLKVYVAGELIETYTLDLAVVYSAPCWRKWLPELRRAGITPQLTYTAFTGQEQAPAGELERVVEGRESVQGPEGWVHRAFGLHFEGGRLRSIDGRVAFGMAGAATKPMVPPDTSQR